MKLSAAVLSGCTTGAAILGGVNAMQDEVTATSYKIYGPLEASENLVAVSIDGHFRLIDRQEVEDLADRQILQVAKKESHRPYGAFRRELGLAD